MKIDIKWLVAAVAGTAAFENGLHNALSHPDMRIGLGWHLAAFGLFCLAATGLELLAVYKQRQRG